jgi:hypothetical protein
MQIGIPSVAFQMRGGDYRIATVISFAGENKTAARRWKKLPDNSSDAGAGFVHKHVSGNATSERSFLSRAHLRRANDGRVHWLSLSEVSVFFFVVFFLLDDFFFFEDFER